jgi:hypothetical protein
LRFAPASPPKAARRRCWSQKGFASSRGASASNFAVPALARVSSIGFRARLVGRARAGLPDASSIWSEIRPRSDKVVSICCEKRAISGAMSFCRRARSSASCDASEASSNVRDIASAADELNASVNEIDGRSRSRTRSRARR